MRQLFLLFFFFIQLNSFGQKLSDKLNYKVTYELTYKIDSTNLNAEKSEYMILYFGDELSVYSSRAKTLANRYIIKGNMGHTNRAAVTDFLFITLKSRETGKIYNTVELAKDLFYYEEDMDLFNWDIQPETKMIKKYHTQKATTSFAGRDYVAWFTPEIPVPEGPYKFNGLPGLILEIADTENHWVFDLVGLEKLSPPKRFRINLKQYIKQEKEPLLTRFNNYRKDPLGYAWEHGQSQNVSMDPKDHKEMVRLFTERLEKMNNPIELE